MYVPTYAYTRDFGSVGQATYGPDYKGNSFKGIENCSGAAGFVIKIR